MSTPLTGFTFEVDGPPEHVEKLWKAVGKVLEEMSREAGSKEPEIFGLGPKFYEPWRLPVRGKIHFRHDAMRGLSRPVEVGENWYEPLRPPLPRRRVGRTVRTISV